MFALGIEGIVFFSLCFWQAYLMLKTYSIDLSAKRTIPI